MKSFIHPIFQTLLIAAITFCLIEAGLRLFPGIIPPGLLYYFEPELRQEAAQGRFLTKTQTVLLERDDGGPPLPLVKPHTEGSVRYTGMSAYNLGRGGIGLHEYIQILKKFGLQKTPRVVTLVVYEGNDLRDAQRYHVYRGKKSSPHRSIVKIKHSLLLRYSYTANLIYAAKRKLSLKRQKKGRYQFSLSTAAAQSGNCLQHKEYRCG